MVKLMINGGTHMKKAYIVLENGRVFEGLRAGAEGNTMGEMVFSTGMGGYIETLTDPAYFGQIVVGTFPMMGNYGMIRADWESSGAFLNGFIVREICEVPSNFRCEGTLEDQLKAWNIPCVCGVDTRELTRILREAGALNAAITDDPASVDMEALRAYRAKDAVKSVSRGGIEHFVGEEARYTVAMYDFGARNSMIRALTDRGCAVTVFPAETSAEEILAAKPDGILLAGGPGDPAENAAILENIKKLLGAAPIMAVGLGNSLLALAAGARCEKMKFGHRGANQPVKRISDGRTFITAQNHGYSIVKDSLPEGAVLSMVNGNDNSCEGVEYPHLRAFGVDFYPAAGSSANSTAYLFTNFVNAMGGI